MLQKHRVIGAASLIFVLLALLVFSNVPRLKSIYGIYRFTAPQPISGDSFSDLEKQSFLKTQETVRAVFRQPQNLLRYQPAAHIAFEGQSQWLHYPDDLSTVFSPSSFYQDAIPAISDFNTQLKDENIELIVLLLPCKWEIYPETIEGSPKDISSSPNLYRQQLVQELREKGISTIDAYEILSKQKSQEPDKTLFYHQDTHWTPHAAEITARHLAPSLKQKLSSTSKHQATISRQEVAIVGDLQSFAKPQQPYQTRRYPARVIRGMSAQSDSPLLLLGDSHLFADLQTELLSDKSPNTPCGFPQQLAVELDTNLDWIAVAGGAAKAARLALKEKLQADPDYLKSKEVLLWVLGGQSFIYGKTSFPLIALNSSDQLPSPQGQVSGKKIATVLARITQGYQLPEQNNSVYPDILTAVSFIKEKTSEPFIGYLPTKTKGQPQNQTLPLQAGRQYKLSLKSWQVHLSDYPEAASYQRLDTLNDFQSPRYLISEITLSNP